MRAIRGLTELRAASGEELGPSQWYEVTQDRVDAFAAATGDDYWLHTDPVRAAETPMGSTIAHGLFTLALGPRFMYELVSFEGFALTFNYGYDRVRFPAPLPVQARVRMSALIVDVTVLPDGARATVEQSFERDEHERPVCVAQLILRFGGRAPAEGD